MPPIAVILCALSAVSGTLAAAPNVGADVRISNALALLGLGWFAVTGSRAWTALRIALVAVAVAAAANSALRRPDGSPILDARTARYAGTVTDRSGVPGERASPVIVLDSGLHVIARVTGDVPPIGSRVVVRGRLEPFADARNPGESSERDLQRERGLDAVLERASLLEVKPTPSRVGTAIRIATWVARAHAWAYEQLTRRLGEPDAAILAGELWGERSSLPPDLRTEFQETGTVHVLVTAGLHVGALAALCIALLAPFSLPRWLTCLLTGAAIWLFAFWSGDALPAVRAACMATVALTARALGRCAFSWNTLGLAALAIAFARPQSVAGASFALSFSCVAAIFACAPVLERSLQRAIELPDRVREALVLSLATQLGTWPLTAAIFLQFAPYAVFANLAIVPCVPVTMALGAAQLALTWCAPLAQASANLNSWLLAWMLGAVRTFSSLPHAVVVASPAPAWCIALYDAALLLAPLLWQRGARVLGLAAIIVAAGLVVWPPPSPDGRLRITVLDVGQADAIVVQTPGGRALLVDAGGRLERGQQGNDSVAEAVGERIVVPFLLRHGIHDLDAIVLSHPHGDHAGGVAPVLRSLRAGALADSGQRYGGHAYEDAIATANRQHVAIVYPRAGMQWRTPDGVVLRFLGPSLPLVAGSRNDINENSVTFTL
ncbi:MAG: ComEC/Rec2 family competence protein, partial [Candidatus Eremiobacteraeota bacterium]|nr:ComEC/Rec2 family competence protein [Candidatus Eremiobacteraeota bacterium]